MQETYLRAFELGVTFCPSYRAFIIQWMEFEINRLNLGDYKAGLQEAGAVARLVHQLRRMHGLAIPQRAKGPRKRPRQRLSRRQARMARRDPLGEVDTPSIPNGLVRRFDEARQARGQANMSREAHIRRSVQVGVEVLKELISRQEQRPKKQPQRPADSTS